MKKSLEPMNGNMVVAGLVRPARMGRLALLLPLLLLGTVRPAHSAPQEQENRQFVPPGSLKAETPTAAEAVKGLGAKHALLIGNHEYANPVWGKLDTVPKELEGLGKALTAAGFALYEGKIHYNLKLADLETLMRGFVTKFGAGQSKQDDQLIIFFSGHGESVRGRGYIVPVDAPGTSPDEDAFVQGALPFSEIEAMAKRADARHLLFAFDSCFSGDLFDFRSAEGPPLPLEVAKIAAGKARLFMTAGKAGEKVPASSEFTPFFTRGVKGEADADCNGYVTGYELFAFLQPRVAAATKNTPRFVPLPGAEYDGDFVFRLPQPAPKPPPVAIENLNELFQGSALASAAPYQQIKELKKVQGALFRAQLYSGEEDDGHMSPAMLEGIRAWQRQHSLPDTGRLDTATLTTFFSSGETEVAIEAATKDKPFINSLGVPFVPVPDTEVLFAAWETRVADYLLFAEETKRPSERPFFPQTNTHPVVNVTWTDAVEFCRWLSVREGVTYRLPTEEEWSLAAGADGILYPWGDEFPPKAVTANIADRAAGNVTKEYLPEYDDGFARTAPVGHLSANSYGISDLGGNVWEWCADSSAGLPGANPEHYCRGGSWQESEKKSLFTFSRLEKKADERSDTIGFRMVVEVPTPPPGKEDFRSKAVALRMLALAASYADTGANRLDTPKLVSSFRALFGLPLWNKGGSTVSYSAASMAYVATRAYLEIEAGPDTPIEAEALRAALPQVRSLLFFPSPAISFMVADAHKRGSWLETPYASPKPGWLVMFASQPHVWHGSQAYHVGIIEAFQDGQITTIEFTTNEPNSLNVGSVVRKTRDLKNVMGYIKTY